MTDRHDLNDDPNDDQLDGLLDQAAWPSLDAKAIERQWSAVSPDRGRRLSLAWVAAAAAVVAAGVGITLVTTPTSSPRTAAVEPPRVEARPEVKPAPTPPTIAARPATADEARRFLERLAVPPEPAVVVATDPAAEARRLVRLPTDALWRARATVAGRPALWGELAALLEAPLLSDRRAAAVLLGGTDDEATYVAAARAALAGADPRAPLLVLATSDHPVAAALLMQLTEHPRTAPAARAARDERPDPPDPTSHRKASHDHV